MAAGHTSVSRLKTCRVASQSGSTGVTTRPVMRSDRSMKGVAVSIVVPFTEQGGYRSSGKVTWMNTMSTQTRKYELKARAESQRETRDRIAGAAAELHQEKG